VTTSYINVILHHKELFYVTCFSHILLLFDKNIWQIVGEKYFETLNCTSSKRSKLLKISKEKLQRNFLYNSFFYTFVAFHLTKIYYKHKEEKCFKFWIFWWLERFNHQNRRMHTMQSSLQTFQTACHEVVMLVNTVISQWSLNNLLVRCISSTYLKDRKGGRKTVI